ncbi:hypothetical protein [Actinomadura atramentaria]|uniref:hypothetical protein n=1 Tax=Actinomadura atramentaria TaxID=1990 RepID=UPI0003A095D5|nr:hypothetical protein [Actinomadura atramentaria]
MPSTRPSPNATSRDVFLERYGYKPAYRYLVEFGGRLYDSKAIVGVAYRYVAGRPLTPDEFSGGRATVVKTLANLGFTVVDNPSPPLHRLIALVQALRVHRTPDGPALHQPIVLLWAFGRAARRRPRLTAWEDARPELRRLLLDHGRPSSRAQPEYPLLALHRAGLWEFTGHDGPVPTAHGEPGRWLDRQNPDGGLPVWVENLAASSPVARAAVLGELGDRFFDGDVPGELLRDIGLEAPAPPSPSTEPSPVDEYVRMCLDIERAEARGDHARTATTTREQPVRSRRSRAAVLIRSDGRCESPRCAGQPEASPTAATRSWRSTTSSSARSGAATTRTR